MNHEAILYDLDGVIIGRPPVQFSALWKYMFMGNRIYIPPELPSTLNRTEDPARISTFFEATSFYFQSLRSVKSGISEHLGKQTADKFGNTGRPNKTPWVKMTRHTLSKGGVWTQFDDIFFKPVGAKTIESKGVAIAQTCEAYEVVTHIDDNPADVLGLAKFFPNVQFIIVSDRSTGILMSRVELREYPNVKRVALLSQEPIH